MYEFSILMCRDTLTYTEEHYPVYRDFYQIMNIVCLFWQGFMYFFVCFF